MRKIVVMISIILAFSAIFYNQVVHSEPEFETHKTYISVTAAKGDTLYSLAEEFCDLRVYGDYRKWIDEVKHMNALTDDTIYHGERYLLPYVHVLEKED